MRATQSRDCHGLGVRGTGLEWVVVTHGEPHVGNAIRTEAGWMLVDWDTTLLAPPEN